MLIYSMYPGWALAGRYIRGVNRVGRRCAAAGSLALPGTAPLKSRGGIVSHSDLNSLPPPLPQCKTTATLPYTNYTA